MRMRYSFRRALARSAKAAKAAPGRNLGYDYLCAIARMFGIPEVRYVSVEGLDVEGANINDLMDGGLAKIDRMLEEDAALAPSAE